MSKSVAEGSGRPLAHFRLQLPNSDQISTLRRPVRPPAPHIQAGGAALDGSCARQVHMRAIGLASPPQRRVPQCTAWIMPTPISPAVTRIVTHRATPANIQAMSGLRGAPSMSATAVPMGGDMNNGETSPHPGTP